MATYDYRVTGAFVVAYESLDDETAAVVDVAILRLLDEHETAWARQGRVAGESGEAWILEVRSRTSDVSLYWDYMDGRLVVLLMMIAR